MDEISEQLLARITDFFVSSTGYNGLPSGKLDDSEMGRVRELVQNGFVTIVFGDRHPTPHIIAFPPEPIVEQLDKLEKEGFGGVCLYPTRSHLETAIDTTEYEGKPYASYWPWASLNWTIERLV